MFFIITKKINYNKYLFIPKVINKIYKMFFFFFFFINKLNNLLEYINIYILKLLIFIF